MTDTSRLQELEAKIANQARQLEILNRALHEKNVALDSLHWVWCDGGCESGAHRFTEGQLTDEIVETAERNTKRMRAWLENYKFQHGPGLWRRIRVRMGWWWMRRQRRWARRAR